MNSRLALRRSLAAGLIATLSIWTIQPGSTIAQTRTEVNAANSLRSQVVHQPKPDLKTVFASEIDGLKSRSLDKADLGRGQTANQTPPSAKFGKRQKIFLALWIVCMTGLVIVLIKHPCRAKDPKDCEPIDDSYSY